MTGMTVEELNEGLEVLQKILDPMFHHDALGMTHDECLEIVAAKLSTNDVILKRTVDMFAGLIVVFSIGYEAPCGYLHAMIDTYKEALAEFN